MDDSKRAVSEFMKYIAAGFAAYIPAVCLIALIAGGLSLRVFLGAVYGSAVMLLYYFLFARATAKAASESDPAAAKKRIQAAYSMRMLLLVLLIGAGILFSTDMAPAVVFHWAPIVAAMIVPRLSIAVWQLSQRAKQKREENADGN